MRVVLAVTYHDPEDRLYEQMARVLPSLAAMFDGLAVRASHTVSDRSLTLFGAVRATVQRSAPDRAVGLSEVGADRRACVALALEMEAEYVLYCDCDRALHWAEQYPDELRAVARHITAYDCTVLGRTRRAFEAHPRMQRETEAIINHVFAAVSGQEWDVTAAARGLSRRAAQALLDGCPDQTIGTDASWPLFLQRAASFSLAYLATEGLEYETADRYGDAIAAAGGRQSWMARLDADPRRWAHRLELARIEVEAMLPYRTAES